MMGVSMSAGPPTCRVRHSVSAVWRCEVRSLLDKAGTLGLALLSQLKQYLWLLEHPGWLLEGWEDTMVCLLLSYSASVTRMAPQR